MTMTTRQCTDLPALKDSASFAQARLDLEVVTWPNGTDVDTAWMSDERGKSKTSSAPLSPPFKSIRLRLLMPTISQFFGIVIQMFWREDAPPHFHALYGEHEALIDIRTLEVIRGCLPRRALSLTIEWANDHREELMEDWTLCQLKQPPKRIEPLE
jgi:hypothetical protein